MSIISAEQQMSVLPDDAENTESLAELSASSATSFINTWTSRRYYPFEDYNSTDGTTRAPSIIVAECKEIGKAFFYLSIDQEDADGKGKQFWSKYLKDKETSLQKIHIPPDKVDQTISLDSNNSMIIGSDNGVGYPQVIPFTAKVTSALGGTWIRNRDFYIRKGGMYEDEYQDAWYLYAIDENLEGTLTYMRTYRSDGADYASYSRK